VDSILQEEGVDSIQIVVVVDDNQMVVDGNQMVVDGNQMVVDGNQMEVDDIQVVMVDSIQVEGVADGILMEVDDVQVVGVVDGIHEVDEQQQYVVEPRDVQVTV